MMEMCHRLVKDVMLPVALGGWEVGGKDMMKKVSRFPLLEHSELIEASSGCTGTSRGSLVARVVCPYWYKLIRFINTVRVTPVFSYPSEAAWPGSILAVGFSAYTGVRWDPHHALLSG